MAVDEKVSPGSDMPEGADPPGRLR
jgi:hypothetical protein